MSRKLILHSNDNNGGKLSRNWEKRIDQYINGYSFFIFNELFDFSGYL